LKATGPVRIGISRCLLGDAVRYDGGHKRDSVLVECLGPYVEWVPVCPEVECGMGTPREPMRLVRAGRDIRLITVDTGIDLTGRMNRYARTRVAELADENLSGYILKKDSPSCGLERVKVYGARRVPARSGRGLFASALLERLPQLPVEEEGRLADPRLRENFVERVFAYARLRTLFGADRWTVASLVKFHTAHKLTLMAHSPDAYRRLGRLVASVKHVSRRDVQRRYREGFMGALAVIATPRRHANVLQHMAGYFKDRLDGGAKRELQTAIEDYRRGRVPRVVPMTLLRHHARVHGVTYLEDQTYLQPHPE
jgi:uncharacterized protein YbgA (DUF1722 family)/uncharacterized protein YbbK (DUF523 family)